MTPLVRDFLWGFEQAWVGLRYFHLEPGLRRWQFVSLIVGLLFFVLNLWFGFTWLLPFLTSKLSLQGVGEGLWFWLGHVLWYVAAVLVGLLVLLFSYLGSLVFAGPIHALIAEKTFFLNASHPPQPQSLGLALRMVFYGILKVVFFVLVGLVCFLMSFVPGLNLLAALILFGIIAFDLSDYAFEVDQRGLFSGIGFILRNFWVYSGFTAAVSLSHFIPGAFFILAPGFVCAATKIYIHLKQREL